MIQTSDTITNHVSLTEKPSTSTTYRITLDIFYHLIKAILSHNVTMFMLSRISKRISLLIFKYSRIIDHSLQRKTDIDTTSNEMIMKSNKKSCQFFFDLYICGNVVNRTQENSSIFEVADHLIMPSSGK